MSDPNRRTTDCRRGLTLVELLVVLAIIFPILTIMIPFDIGSHEVARRTRRINNLKSIGLTLHNHAEARGGFPPSATPANVPPAPERKRSETVTIDPRGYQPDGRQAA